MCIAGAEHQDGGGRAGGARQAGAQGGRTDIRIQAVRTEVTQFVSAECCISNCWNY